jgi:hypothetical protein
MALRCEVTLFPPPSQFRFYCTVPCLKEYSAKLQTVIGKGEGGHHTEYSATESRMRGLYTLYRKTNAYTLRTHGCWLLFILS